MLNYLNIKNYTTETGKHYQNLPLSYQVFGKKLDSYTSVVLINHALTGNSNVSGENGWWNQIVGDNKIIDLKNYSIICFNIPFNNFNNNYNFNYQDFETEDVAKIFIKGLDLLKIKKINIGIGGSLGGGVLWHMAINKPSLFNHIIPIACSWKTSNWLYSITNIQEKTVLTSNNIDLARQSAMIFYRTKDNFDDKFKNFEDTESWLKHHGKSLSERFSISSYLLVNKLLQSIDIFKNKEKVNYFLKNFKGEITNIYIDSDLMFTQKEIKQIHRDINKHIPSKIFEIKSTLGHDAFLVEHEQINTILNKVINYKEIEI